MIKELYCELFKQQKIAFKQGLNVVLGDDVGSNSIGKSTALLAIDYMLGGNHYQNKSDIINHVGHHTVFASFVFNNENYYFARKTENSDTVFKSTSDYHIIEGSEMTLTQYRDFLQDKYSLDIFGCTLRTFIGLFARIYDRGNYIETLPLQEHQSESMESGIMRLVKIFGIYEEIETLDKNVKTLSERNKVLKKALSIDLIKGVKNKTEAKKIAGQIKSLQQDIDVLTVELTSREVPLNVVQLHKVLSIKEELAKIQVIKYKVDIKLRRIQNNLQQSKQNSVIDLAKLKMFFPEANIMEIAKINHFHSSLCNVLADEMTTQIASLTNYRAKLDACERNLLESIKEVVVETNATKIGVQQLAAMQKKMLELVEATSNYEKENSYNKEKKDAEVLYNNTLQKKLTEIQQFLNAKISDYNGTVYDNKKKPPLLTLQPKRYIYDCPDDEGTGSRYSGLVLFDLSVFKSTKVPVLFHDSLILKNIEDRAIETIMKLYETFNEKQIFIAFDKKTSYSKETQDIVIRNKVLELATNGYELFGEQWSRTKTE